MDTQHLKYATVFHIIVLTICNFHFNGYNCFWYYNAQKNHTHLNHKNLFSLKKIRNNFQKHICTSNYDFGRGKQDENEKHETFILFFNKCRDFCLLSVRSSLSAVCFTMWSVGFYKSIWSFYIQSNLSGFSLILWYTKKEGKKPFFFAEIRLNQAEQRNIKRWQNCCLSLFTES